MKPTLTLGVISIFLLSRQYFCGYRLLAASTSVGLLEKYYVKGIITTTTTTTGGPAGKKGSWSIKALKKVAHVLRKPETVVLHLQGLSNGDCHLIVDDDEEWQCNSNGAAVFKKKEAVMSIEKKGHYKLKMIDSGSNASASVVPIRVYPPEKQTSEKLTHKCWATGCKFYYYEDGTEYTLKLKANSVVFVGGGMIVPVKITSTECDSHCFMDLHLAMLPTGFKEVQTIRIHHDEGKWSTQVGSGQTRRSVRTTASIAVVVESTEDGKKATLKYVNEEKKVPKGTMAIVVSGYGTTLKPASQESGRSFYHQAIFTSDGKEITVALETPIWAVTAGTAEAAAPMTLLNRKVAVGNGDTCSQKFVDVKEYTEADHIWYVTSVGNAEKAGFKELALMTNPFNRSVKNVTNYCRITAWSGGASVTQNHERRDSTDIENWISRCNTAVGTSKPLMVVESVYQPLITSAIIAAFEDVPPNRIFVDMANFEVVRSNFSTA